MAREPKKVKEKKMHFWNYLNFKKMQARSTGMV